MGGGGRERESGLRLIRRNGVKCALKKNSSKKSKLFKSIVCIRRVQLRRSWSTGSTFRPFARSFQSLSLSLFLFLSRSRPRDLYTGFYILTYRCRVLRSKRNSIVKFIYYIYVYIKFNPVGTCNWNCKEFFITSLHQTRIYKDLWKYNVASHPVLIILLIYSSLFRWSFRLIFERESVIVGSTFSHNKIKYFSLSSKRFIHFFVPRVERIRGEDWWKIIVRKVKREGYYALALAKNIGERQFFREITVSLVLRTKLYIFNRRLVIKATLPSLQFSTFRKIWRNESRNRRERFLYPPPPLLFFF